jgi:hypothetical protein
MPPNHWDLHIVVKVDKTPNQVHWEDAACFGNDQDIESLLMKGYCYLRADHDKVRKRVACRLPFATAPEPEEVESP